MITAERLAALADKAYRDMGYTVVRFRDGSKGVLRCPAKTIALMNRFALLVLDEAEAGVGTLSLSTPRKSIEGEPIASPDQVAAPPTAAAQHKGNE